MTVKRGLALTGIAAGSTIAIILLMLVFLAVATLFWGVVVFYGSMFVHWAFEGVDSATFRESLGLGFIFAIITTILGRNNK